VAERRQLLAELIVHLPGNALPFVFLRKHQPGDQLPPGAISALPLADLFAKVKKLPERPLWLSSDKRPLSDLPPIKIAAKAPVDPEIVDGGVDSEARKRAPRPRKNPGIATA